MHRSETRELANCAICGAEIAPATDRAFAFGVDSYLCYACAVKRGGSWNELHDHWDADPDTSEVERAER
ncbi:MAG: hypothetical protein DCC71_02525 [Proteobacteria bacterium]|nr:MAG: hypothetical protein DCC71_02525 [Pseudomonadota bacterium]